MEAPVIIEKARETGFCCGVKRAIALLEKAAETNGEVETLGPVVHNRQVVASLAERGIKQVSRLDSVKSKLVAITAHGTDPATLKEIERRQLKAIDTTCAIVKSAQKIADRFARADYGIVIFGDPEHTEVKGLLGWSGNRAIATTDPDEVISWSCMPRRLAIISQSTQEQTSFYNFIKKILDTCLRRLHEVHIANTICGVTSQRQKSARELAERCDLVFVVGGKDSANSRRLAEICGQLVETHFIETADDIRRTWLKGHKHIGVVAGTSTPDYVANEVVAQLKKLTGG